MGQTCGPPSPSPLNSTPSSPKSSLWLQVSTPIKLLDHSQITINQNAGYVKDLNRSHDLVKDRLLQSRLDQLPDFKPEASERGQMNDQLVKV